MEFLAKLIVRFRKELELVPVFSLSTSSIGRSLGGVANGGGCCDDVGYGVNSGDDIAVDGCEIDGIKHASSSVVKPSQKLWSDMISSIASSILLLGSLDKLMTGGWLADDGPG